MYSTIQLWTPVMRWILDLWVWGSIIDWGNTKINIVAKDKTKYS